MAMLTLNPPKYSSSNDLTGLDAPDKHIIDKAVSIATYYIPFHLRRSVEHSKLQGLPKHYLIPPQQPPELFTFIVNVCTDLEQKNIDFFHNLPESLDLQANNAKTVFISLCKTVFTDETINWGRVMSIFTLAATFAVYFTKKNQLNVVTKIPKWLGEVIESELADWIIEQGGWEDVRNKLSPNKSAENSSKWSRVIAYGGVMAAAGFLLYKNGKLM